MNTKPIFVNHDYPPNWQDKGLAAIRAVFPTEFRHDSLRHLAGWGHWLPGMGFHLDTTLQRVISFPDRSNPLYLGSPIILPAGACKYGENIADYAKLGFGGVSVGTATSEARLGNTFRPRVSTIPMDRAINNSMGLNNPGINPLCKAVDASLGKAHKHLLSVGISVAETPEIQDHDQRLEDLLRTFRKAYNCADYVEINVSCPNTGNKRVDADTRFIEELFTAVMKIRKDLPVRRAVYAKLSPDMNESQLTSTLEILDSLGVNGLILFNTFPSARMEYLKMQTPADHIANVTSQGGKGGISGRILYRNTFNAVSYIKQKFPRFSIIASGGIDHGAKVWDLLHLGADAVQSYSVVAYRWNAIHKMRKELKKCLAHSDYSCLQDLFSF
jgi:dihydroorotate dehydrogenase